MGTIYDKLNYLDGTKGLIRDAINDKGGSLTPENTFRSYADAINNIQTGGSLIKADFTQENFPFKHFCFYGSPDIWTGYTPSNNGALFANSGYQTTVEFAVPLICDHAFYIKFGEVTELDVETSTLTYAISFLDRTRNNTICAITKRYRGLTFWTDNQNSLIIPYSISQLSNKIIKVCLRYDKSDISSPNGNPYVAAGDSKFELYINDDKIGEVPNATPIYLNDFSMIPSIIKFNNVDPGLVQDNSWKPYVKELGVEKIEAV